MWVIKHALRPWLEGKPLFKTVAVDGDLVVIDGETWDVMESSVPVESLFSTIDKSRL